MTLRDLPSIDVLLQSEAGAGLRDEFGHTLAVDALRLEVESGPGGGTPGRARLRPLPIWWRGRAAGCRYSSPPACSPSSMPPVSSCIPTSDAPCSARTPNRPCWLPPPATPRSNTISPAANAAAATNIWNRCCARSPGPRPALVVNNNAAAVLLTLTALARRREVVISRSQLIEIGGGFRIPEVLTQSGARLVEVGTTNRTHRGDIEAALGPKTGLLLRAHTSNFKLVGFTTVPSLTEMVELGRGAGVPVVDDLGSGALLDTQPFGLGHEPTVQESVQAGASLVTFSGDKLLGGPQAGIVVGEPSLIEKLRKHPLARAVRADKMALAGLHATLLHYARGEAVEQIPVWRMIAMAADDIRRRAEGWAAELGRGTAVAARSTVGGGSLPEETLPTWALAVESEHVSALAAQLRQATPAVIGRVESGRLLLDPRTVLPEQDAALLDALRHALASS